MDTGCSSLSIGHSATPASNISLSYSTRRSHNRSNLPSKSIPVFPRQLTGFQQTSLQIAVYQNMASFLPLSVGFSDSVGAEESHEVVVPRSLAPPLSFSLALREKLVYEALVWSSLNGLVVGDKNVKNSGNIPGVGMVHAPFSLLPTPLRQSYWKQACELAPIFNELVDRVSLDGKFLQDSLSRTRNVDAFTSRLLDIHSKMMEINKKEVIRLGLHRSDYMVDAETNLLLQIELNTISSSFPGLGCLVSNLHRYLINQLGMDLGLSSKWVPINTAVSQFAEAMAKAWNEYDNKRAVVMFVVQPEERNMYDQHWLSFRLKELLIDSLQSAERPGPIMKAGKWDLFDLYKDGVSTIRKTLAEIDSEGELLADGSLSIGGQIVAVVYFRAGYSPNDYPSESEWHARIMMEQSAAIKCPSISYHLAGTKKIQQELAKPTVLERFLEDEDVAKLRKCFAGLWSLDDSEIVKQAIERPELFVLKPQREGGGNNLYGLEMKEMLLKLQQEKAEEQAAYILMQRIFPSPSLSYLIREGLCHQNQAISELGIYGAYLRSNDKVIMNEMCGYLMRTKVSSSNEGGVAAGFAVLDSLYLT